MLEIYLKTIEDIKKAALSLIEKERNTGICRQDNKETLVCKTELALGETDRLFEVVMGLPGDDEELYMCRHLIIEALEDLRESFENRFCADRGPDNSSGAYWQVQRAGYLMKIQAAEQQVRKLLL